MSLNSFFAIFGGVVHFEKWATGSGFCDAFEAIGYFLDVLVVHSVEWTTSSGHL